MAVHDAATSTSYRTCALCEASCGLEMTVAGGEVIGVRGDADDVFSHGYLCPKGASLPQLHADGDRLSAPLVREGDDRVTVGWDDAFAATDRLLRGVLDRHGRHAVATYVGNPSGADLSAALYHRVLHRALGTHNFYTVATIDQMPKSVSCALMFGSPLNLPVPDLDRTQHVIVLGANPAVSNGSLIGAPDLRRRLRAVQERGGKVVVIDPCRTRTAREASEHCFVRPGTDALLLAAMAHVLFADGLVALGRLAPHVAGVDAVRDAVAALAPERVAGACGVPAAEIGRLATELATAPAAAVYGRIGSTAQRFGTLTSWLIDVLNVLTGNLDRPGGAMIAQPAAYGPTSADVGSGRAVQLGRWRSRVSGRPEALGELPAACLAEEIATPGPEQVRALITLAGNPVLSAPGGVALDAALGRLDAMVSHDFYLNETTRHAHVILPATSPLERPHYPLGVYPYAVRNVANWSPPVLPLAADRPPDWEIVLRLAAIVAGAGADFDVARADEDVARRAVQRRVDDPGCPVAGRDPEELLAALAPRVGPERLLDLLLRCGPYGDGFGAREGGLTLAVLEAAPHGVDLGPLQARLPGALRTPSGKVELAPPALLAELPELVATLDAVPERPFVLIGRRELRTLNSWLHNLPNMAGGPRRCTLHMHPDDAAAADVAHGDLVRVSSRAGSLEVPVELTDAVMPGVVSMPHGWGHEDDGTRQAVALREPGVNMNRLTDGALLDATSGTAALNGVPVDVVAVPAAAAAGAPSAW